MNFFSSSFKNFKFFLKNLNNEKYRTDYKINGSCNYAFPIILKTNSIKKRDNFEKILSKHYIEFRRGNAGGGNQLRQPYLRKLFGNIYKNYPEVDHIHFYGFYIGNYPSLKEQKIYKLCDLLNSVK